MELPLEVLKILDKLHTSGFEAYAVGGCVRDLLRGVKPKDWDIATSARPREIQKLFPCSFYENRFGTVTVNTGSRNSSLKEIEITTFRTEESYTDQRHPDHVIFTNRIQDDLARRDFSINAIALQITDSTEEVIDPFNGKKDLEQKMLRAVGDPEKRFSEDALRLMRAVRLAVTLEFTIEEKTLEALKNNVERIKNISPERIRDELIKIVMCPNAEKGIALLQETGILPCIIPELSEGVGVKQNKHHIYTVFEHNIKSLGFSARAGDPLHIRLAVLFHDVAKPQTKKGEYPDATFYGHDIVGAAMTRRILKRLRFPRKTIEQVTRLVRYHLFAYDVDVVTEAGVRRLLRRVGPENFKDLIRVRVAERLGSGVPKAKPYRLRHLEFMAEKVSKDPLSVKMLKVNGNDLMKELKLAPGPKIGALLEVLLAEVLESPKLNRREYLLKRAKELAGEDLAKLQERARDVVKEKERKREEEIRRKYHV